MSQQNQTIRQQFLAIACQYLFGHRSAACTGALRLQPAPVRPLPRSR